jgi:hypothetical protein
VLRGLEAVDLGLLGADHVEQTVDLALLLGLELLVQLAQTGSAFMVGAVWPGASAAGRGALLHLAGRG